MMRPIARSIVLGAFACGWLGPRPTDAQVIQLPTYRVFSTGTSVLVPDGGGIILGGVDGAASATRGQAIWPGPNSRIAQRGIRGQATETRVTILDHREWDASVLAQASQAQRGSIHPKAQRIARGLEHFTPTASTTMLAAQARRQQSQQDAAADRNARQLIAQGDACRQRNQPAAARIFYRTAWREGRGDVRAVAQARLKELTP
jgi:hypothetical protein